MADGTVRDRILVIRCPAWSVDGGRQTATAVRPGRPHPAGQVRDAAAFETVIAAIEEVAPGLEVLRPGLLACPLRGPLRFFGSVGAVAEELIDTVGALDVECTVGIADHLEVAVLAAARSRIIPPGGDRSFCAALPLTALIAEPAITDPTWPELVDLLTRLGITTAGALADLPAARVASRFGPAGQALYRLAAGRPDRIISRRTIPTGLSVDQHYDPPLEQIDTAAFAARTLADALHHRLVAAGLACTRLTVTATTTRGTTLARTWRCTVPLSPAATADRVRWQLDGWLTAGGRSTPGTGEGDGMTGDGTTGAVPAPIAALRLEPTETVEPGRIQHHLWGGGSGSDEQAGRVLARLQGLLGPAAVRTAARTGGRGPADRISLADWGERHLLPRDVAAPWPGALPAPAATTVLTPDTTPPGTAPPGADGRERPVTLTDPEGRPVILTARGLLNGIPDIINGRRVRSWAGPWLLDERWWEQPAARRARLQIVPVDGPPLLLQFGPAGWAVEAVYH